MESWHPCNVLGEFAPWTCKPREERAQGCEVAVESAPENTQLAREWQKKWQGWTTAPRHNSRHPDARDAQLILEDTTEASGSRQLMLLCIFPQLCPPSGPPQAGSARLFPNFGRLFSPAQPPRCSFTSSPLAYHPQLYL